VVGLVFFVLVCKKAAKYSSLEVVMKCPHCGAELDTQAMKMFALNAMVVGSLKCGGCGRSIPADALSRPGEQARASPQSSKSPSFSSGNTITPGRIMAVVILLCFLAFGLYFLMSK
jgi:hypothetical protein